MVVKVFFGDRGGVGVAGGAGGDGRMRGVLAAAAV